MRFKRWSENGLFWKILTALKERKFLEIRVVFMDSTTVKVHRQGSGAPKKKRAAERREKRSWNGFKNP
jgi:hypothetical protein